VLYDFKCEVCTERPLPIWILPKKEDKLIQSPILCGAATWGVIPRSNFLDAKLDKKSVDLIVSVRTN